MWDRDGVEGIEWTVAQATLTQPLPLSKEKKHEAI